MGKARLLKDTIFESDALTDGRENARYEELFACGIAGQTSFLDPVFFFRLTVKRTTQRHSIGDFSFDSLNWWVV